MVNLIKSFRNLHFNNLNAPRPKRLRAWRSRRAALADYRKSGIWEDDWFDYRLENDPRFLRRIERARMSLQAGRGVRLEDVNDKA